MDCDRGEDLARFQRARSRAGQLQVRLAAVARALGDSYQEAARQHEQLAVNRRPPTTVDHLVMAKTCRALADRAVFTARTWEEPDESADHAPPCPHCASAIPRDVLISVALGRSSTVSCPSCGAVARLALQAVDGGDGDGDGDQDCAEGVRSAIVQERLRIACGLNDEVVSHLFAAVLRLDGALMLTDGPLRQRLVEAIGRVDAGIRAIRDVAFGLVAERKRDGRYHSSSGRVEP